MKAEIQKNINVVESTMRLVGMPLTFGDKEMLRHCLEGELSFDEEHDKIIQEAKRINK